MASNKSTTKIPAEYEPISMWGYFGYEVLFMIPVIGWICIGIFALTASNHNLRNFARSQFCVLIIWAVFMAAMFVSGFLAYILEFDGIKIG